MGTERTDLSCPYVSNDHCKQVSLRIEEKVDRNTEAVDNLTATLQPQIATIVRLDAYFRVVKGIVIFIFSGGFLAGAYRLITYISHHKK